MDFSPALDHFSERRDLLRAHLAEYLLLHDEHPDVTDVLTFDAYVQFSSGIHAQYQLHERLAKLEQQLLLLRRQL